MTAPIRTDIRDGLESMRDTMVDLVFISFLNEWILKSVRQLKGYAQHEKTYRFGIALRDTLCYHLGITFAMTSIATVFALIPACLKQEITAVRAHHDLVELSLNELVPVHLMDFASAHADSALSAEFSGIDRTTADVLLDWKKGRKKKDKHGVRLPRPNHITGSDAVTPRRKNTYRS